MGGSTATAVQEATRTTRGRPGRGRYVPIEARRAEPEHEAELGGNGTGRVTEN